jgi:hypothetical protein
MGRLDFKTPFDQLTELRATLTVGEIAEMTGVRRETLSRARPDSRFQRRTQKALDDLYVVVTRLMPTIGGDSVHLASIMRRPQSVLAERSIAGLLREGRVDLILEHLDPPAPTEEEQLENIEFDPDVLAELSAAEDEDHGALEAKHAAEERRFSSLVSADSELASRLPRIESKIHEHFGADVRIRRAVIVDHSASDGRDRIYLGVRSGFAFDEEVDLLADFLVSDEELLGPVRDRLVIGNM